MSVQSIEKISTDASVEIWRIIRLRTSDRWRFVSSRWFVVRDGQRISMFRRFPQMTMEEWGKRALSFLLVRWRILVDGWNLHWSFLFRAKRKETISGDHRSERWDTIHIDLLCRSRERKTRQSIFRSRLLLCRLIVLGSSLLDLSTLPAMNNCLHFSFVQISRCVNTLTSSFLSNLSSSHFSSERKFHLFPMTVSSATSFRHLSPPPPPPSTPSSNLHRKSEEEETRWRTPPFDERNILSIEGPLTKPTRTSLFNHLSSLLADWNDLFQWREDSFEEENSRKRGGKLFQRDPFFSSSVDWKSMRREIRISRKGKGIHCQRSVGNE